MADNANPTTPAGDDEVYARWIYQPRFIDENGELTEAYVSLRNRQDGNHEDGISGMLLNRTTHEEVLRHGEAHKWKPKKNKDPELFWGYGKAVVYDIRAIAEGNDVVDVHECPSPTVPFHAIILFILEGERIRGNTSHPRMLRYKERLKNLLNSNRVKA